jgi:type IV pilus assembly protein PilA
VSRVPRSAGFTWIEMMAVLGVVAILALMAIPAMQEGALKKQVKEAMALADVAKPAVQSFWTMTGEMPEDNKAAGLPPPEKIVGNLVSGVSVAGGAVTLTFGNNAGKSLHGKKLTLRPAIVPGEGVVPIAWLCHNVAVPKGMEVRGRDETDLQSSQLPVDCRPAPADKQ